MLLYLTNSLILERSDASYNRVKKAVRNVALAAFEGKHILLGDLEAIEHFYNIFISYEDDVSMVFNKLMQNLSMAVVPASITRYVEITKDQEGEETANGKTTIKVTYSSFLDTRTIQPTALICEDIVYDYRLYRYILNWFQSRNGYNFNVNYEETHGGGGRTEDVLMSYVNNKTISLCIVDADRMFPNQPSLKTSTAYKCKKIRRGLLNGLLELDVHEAENLLPINFIVIVPDHLLPPNKKKLVNQLTKDKMVAEQVLRYFDYKQGLVKSDELANNADYYQFSKMICECNPAVLKGGSFEKYYNETKDKQELFPGIAKRLLHFTLDVMEKETRIKPDLMSYQTNEWIRLGQELLNYCCAQKEETMLY